MTNVNSFKQEQASYMLMPIGRDEEQAVALFQTLTKFADRFRRDEQGLLIVMQIASALNRLAGDWPIGRIDQSFLQGQVRDVVTRAGGDPNEL